MSSVTLNDISDVNAATPSSSQVLTYNGSEWVASTASATVLTLDDVGDVSISGGSPTTNNVLKWNGSVWTNNSVDASELSGTALPTGVVTSSLTSVGSLSSLTVAGTTTLQQSLEKTTAGGNLTGTTNIDILTSAVHTYTGTGNFTFNFRGNGSTTLNSLMTVNQSLTVVVFVANTTARTLSEIQIDGTTTAVLTQWFGGSGIPSGNANSTDVYTITIIKRGSATYTVYASQSKFA